MICPDCKNVVLLEILEISRNDLRMESLRYFEYVQWQLAHIFQVMEYDNIVVFCLLPSKSSYFKLLRATLFDEPISNQLPHGMNVASVDPQCPCCLFADFLAVIGGFQISMIPDFQRHHPHTFKSFDPKLTLCRLELSSNK